MCAPGTGRRTLQAALRTLEFLAATIIIGVYSYFLAVLGSHKLDVPSNVRTVEAIAGASMLWVLIASVALRCVPGLPLTSFLLVIGDLGFACTYIYVATTNSAGSGSCVGSVNTPLGSGDSDSPAGASPDNPSPSGMPSLHLVCQLLTACLAVSILLIFFHLMSIAAEIAICRQRYRETVFGPGGKPPSKMSQPAGHPHMGFRNWFQARPSFFVPPDRLPAHAGPDSIVQIGTVTEFGSSDPSDVLAEARPQSPQERYVEVGSITPDRRAATTSSGPERRPNTRPITYPEPSLRAPNRVDSSRNLSFPASVPTRLNPAAIAAAEGFRMPYHFPSNPDLRYTSRNVSQPSFPQPHTANGLHRTNSFPLLDEAAQIPINPVHRTGTFAYSNPQSGASAGALGRYTNSPSPRLTPSPLPLSGYPPSIQHVDSFPRPLRQPQDVYPPSPQLRRVESFPRQLAEPQPQSPFVIPPAGTPPLGLQSDRTPTLWRQQIPFGQASASPVRQPSPLRQEAPFPPAPAYPQDLPYPDVNVPDAHYAGHMVFPRDHGPPHAGPVDAYLPNANYNYH